MERCHIIHKLFGLYVSNRKKRVFHLFLLVILCLNLCLCGCSAEKVTSNEILLEQDTSIKLEESECNDRISQKQDPAKDETVNEDESAKNRVVPEYQGIPYVIVNNNIPDFTEADYRTSSFEDYGELDSLNRCGVVWANINVELMPTEDRGEIGLVKPSGWHTVKYDFVDGMFLYNRCHLIGYQLTGENANEKNLITGTRYMNVEGMLSFENYVAEYIKNTGNAVLYRVTPIFVGDELVARGVIMEAASQHDQGQDLSFAVYIYNVQPGVEIDYATGESTRLGFDDKGKLKTPKTGTVIIPFVVEQSSDIQVFERVTKEDENDESVCKSDEAVDAETVDTETIDDEAVQNKHEWKGTQEIQYILNIKTKKFHIPSCGSVNDMKEKNKEMFFGTKEDAVQKGYSPCKRCMP